MGSEKKRPSVGDRMLEQSYRLMASDLRPKPPAPPKVAAPEAPADVSVDDLAALASMNGA